MYPSWNMGSLEGTDSGLRRQAGDHAFSTRRSLFFALSGLQSICGNRLAVSFFSCGSICLCRSSRGLKYNCFIQFRYLAILFVFPYKRLFRRIY